MSQNDIVARVLSRLEERNTLNEDQLIEGVINLLEESGVDLDNISEEKLDEIFRSIGKAIGSFMTGGEFKDPARRNADFKGAINKAGFQRKMRDRQAQRAQMAAQAAKKPIGKKKPVAGNVGKAPVASIAAAASKKPMGKPNPAMAARKPLSKKARNAEFAATRDKARSMRRRDLALESRIADMLSDILIEQRLDEASPEGRMHGRDAASFVSRLKRDAANRNLHPKFNLSVERDLRGGKPNVNPKTGAGYRVRMPMLKRLSANLRSNLSKG